MKRTMPTRSSILAVAAIAVTIPSFAQAIDYDTVITFDDALVLSATQTPGAWYVDRYAPDAFESQFSFGGDNRLRLSIDGDNGVDARAPSFNSTFYNTHGRKLDLPAGAYAVTADVYVPTDWTTPTARRRSDIWTTGVNSTGGGVIFPIIGVANIEGTPIIRYWDIYTGWVTVPMAVTAETWYTFGIALEGGAVVYTINGAVVASIPSPTTVALTNAMIQGYNFNDPALLPIQQSSEDYSAIWDNLGYASAKVTNVTASTVHATIQAAIDAASPNDIIELASGVYDGAVLVNKDGLTIRAEAGASSKPRVQISGSTAALGTIQIAPGADGIVIQGLEIVGIDGPMGLEKAAVYFQGGHVGATVTGNTITAAGDSALLTEYGLSNTGFTITGNLFNGQTFTGTAGGAFGLGAGANQYSTANWPRPAVYMGSNPGPTHMGINFSGNTVATITGDGTNGNGGVLIDATNLTVSGNTFSGSSGGRPGTETLRVRGINSDVTGNTFASTSSVAINVGGTVNDTVGTSEVTGNIFTGAFTVKVANNSAGQLNATLNFWGDASLPVSPSDFFGNVAALPFYKDAALSEAGPVRVAGVGYATIQGAINAVATVAGSTVEVDAGTYAENVTLGKDLDIVGAGSASTIVSSSGTIFAITSGGSGSTVSGIATTGGARGFNLNGVSNVLLENVASSGNSSFGINFDGANSGVTLRSSSFSNNTSSGIKVASAARISNFAIDACTVDGNAFGLYSADGNFATYSANAQLDGITVNNGSTFSNNASKGIFIESMNNGLFEDITVSNSGTGTTGGTGSGIDINLKYANYSNLTIRNSLISNCGENYSFGGGILVKARNDGSYAVNPATLGGTVLLEGLRVESCGGVGNGAGIRVGDSVANVSPSNVVIQDSAFSGNNQYAVLNLVTGATVEASHNHWGTTTGPVGASSNGVAGAVNFNPWYANSDASVPPVLSNLTTGILANTEISTVQPNVSNLYIAPGSTVTVTPTGGLSATNLEVADGGKLVVNGGDLTIGSSTISGSFTIFNSFGSWEINGNTTFEISQSLALISDIHVAAGVTLTVNGGGELILDGCVIDSQTSGTPYNIVADANGLLTMARCVVTDAVIDINTVDASVAADKQSKIYDNSFTTSEIEATVDAAVYHNLFDAATDTASPGPFAAVDGWSNITSIGDANNRFSLEFAAPVPLLVGRTLDTEGNLFVQSGDQVVIDMDVSALDPDGITSAEALLGYNSDLLDPTGSPTVVAPADDWDVVVESEPVGSTGLGLVDSALGLELDFAGTSVTANSNIASVTFEALAPGATVGFLRVQTDGVFDGNGQLLKDTRLTKFTAPSTFSLIAPFTSNTGELVIDDADPSIATPAVSGTQVQPSVGSVNVLLPTTNYVLRNGTPVILTFTATDSGLSGLDAADATSDLSLVASDGVTVLDSSDYTVAATESLGTVTYTVTLVVPPAATTGEYDVTATVRDRSGNVSPLAALGSFNVANEVIATVQLEAFGGTTRAVTFVATDSSGVPIGTWSKTITDFSGGIGSVALENVPAGTVAISAKSTWTLRSKLPVTFSGTGVSSVALTGANMLDAGDLTGDNVVNTLDYSVLRFNWLTMNSVADISGDGVVNNGDFYPLQSNFYTVGDPQ